VKFANLFTVILLLVAAGLAVLAGLPVLRRWQRERDGGWSDGAVQGLAGPASTGYGADVAMEERGHLTQPDHPRLVDHHPLDDQDEQMRNRPADEQHHRHSQLGGSERPRQAEEPDPRRSPAVPVNGRYGGFGDVNGDLPANDVNGGYEHEGANSGYESDEAGRAAHFDWKVAAQYERARAARNASMSSFDPPPLPSDGPGTFTEEIPAIHAADGQRRHPAVHADPVDDPARPPLSQRHAGPPVEPPSQSPYEDPWGSDGAEHAPPAFEFDEQGYEAYDEHRREQPGYDREQSPYGGFAEPVDADELAPPPHMRWRPDPEPDPAQMEEPPYGGPGAPPGPRQAFGATTFRVQPAAEEPVAVHVAEPGLPAGPHGAYAGADPAAPVDARYGVDPVAPPGGGYAPGGVPDDQPVDGWVGEDTAIYQDAEPAHGFAGGYAPPAPPTGYDPGRYDPPAKQPVFEEPAEAPAGDDAPPFGHFSPAPDPRPTPPPRPPLPDLSPLLADDEVSELRQRWNEIKGTFPDDPVTSVKEASELVGECTKLFERRLGVDPDSAEVSTEELRLALQRYLAFFERLLSS
jgi:hypothetical protein